jgi:hypothetical protein
LTIRLRLTVAFTAIYVIAAGLMFGWFIPAVVAACGAPPLDSRFTWARDDAQALVAACGPAGVHAYSQMAVLDLFYPALFAVCLGSWTVWLATRIGMRRWLILFALAPTAVNVFCDYLENAAVWTLLRSGPAAGGPLLDIGGIFTMIKNLAGTFAFLTAAVLLVAYIAQAVRRRRTTLESRAPTAVHD